MPVFLMIIYLGVLIYMIWLASRFVQAMEKIAEKFEGPRPSA